MFSIFSLCGVLWYGYCEYVDFRRRSDFCTGLVCVAAVISDVLIYYLSALLYMSLTSLNQSASLSLPLISAVYPCSQHILGMSPELCIAWQGWIINFIANDITFDTPLIYFQNA